jgi:hypothetical protein
LRWSSSATHIIPFSARGVTRVDDQITAVGNRHKATGEQVLNHVLPALAKVKPGAKVTAEYVPESGVPDR